MLKFNRNLRKSMRETLLMWRLYVMLLPVLLYFLIFKYVPMYGVVMAFQDYNLFDGVFGSSWVGLGNFKMIFSSIDFYKVIRNTLMLNALSMLFGFPIPIIVALLLNEVRLETFKKSVQTIICLPHFLSWVIVASLFIPLFSISGGLINNILTALGIEKISFMMIKSWWVAIYVFLGVWKEFGWGTIIYLAALTAVSPELCEAAEIDGASRFKQILHVHIPSIAPTIIVDR
ncbi:MAG: sugar ABC transporter permease, partial [Clostridiales bacterium]|nr:sugar ABC transporter permease [Clostridiales bacterium]